MQKPVEDGGCCDLVAEHGAPLDVALVGRNDDAALGVALGQFRMAPIRSMSPLWTDGTNWTAGYYSISRSAVAEAASGTAADLAIRIVSCPEVERAFGDVNHRCHQVVTWNNPTDAKRPPWVRPEPWVGDITKARLLFVSSNPGSVEKINDRRELPASPTDSESISRMYQQGLNGDGVTDAKGNRVHYWAQLRKLAEMIFGATVAPGEDYALTELVHCGSHNEAGVANALYKCPENYLGPLLQVSAASVLVLVGRWAREYFTNHVLLQPIRYGEFSGPVELYGHERLILSTPHPSAWAGDAQHGFSPAQIGAARQTLGL